LEQLVNRIFNSFRSAVAGTFLLACIGTLLLWPVTSKHNFELFNNVSEWELYCVESWNGKLRISHNTNMGKSAELNHWRFWSIDESRMHADYAQYTREWNSSLFGGSWNKDEMSLFLPHLYWAALAGLFAYAIKPKPKLQFAFHDLLMMTALIAIIIGLFTLTNHLAERGSTNG